MFWHNFKYSFKTLIRNKTLLFWTFAFPILLGIFFHMAFSDIEKSETFGVIDIAIVENNAFHQNKFFQKTFKFLSRKGENQVFHIQYVSLKKAKDLLKKEQIIGYLQMDDEVHIVVHSSGVQETIFKYIVDEMISNQKMIEDLASNEIEQEYARGNATIDYNKIYAEITKLIDSDTKSLDNVSNPNLSYTMIEYYTLIAMVCLYGGVISMFVTNYKLANMNCVGKRTSISPISKAKMLTGSLLASYVVQMIGLFLLFIFTIFVLNVDYGKHILPIFILAITGSLAGLSLGIVVATFVKSNENTKTGILIAITMLGCFLSGMMGITMKYIIDKNIPIMNKINPASMITDGFYSLYYYSTFHRFIFDVVSLVIFSVIMIFLSLQGLRRQKYDSI